MKTGLFLRRLGSFNWLVACSVLWPDKESTEQFNYVNWLTRDHGVIFTASLDFMSAEAGYHDRLLKMLIIFR